MALCMQPSLSFQHWADTVFGSSSTIAWVDFWDLLEKLTLSGKSSHWKLFCSFAQHGLDRTDRQRHFECVVNKHSPSLEVSRQELEHFVCSTPPHSRLASLLGAVMTSTWSPWMTEAAADSDPNLDVILAEPGEHTRNGVGPALAD
jgi:hypothetical protein